MTGRDRPMRGPRVAASFLTRVPLHRDGEIDIAGSTPWFPVVGLLIGLVGGGVFALASEVLPPPVGAALALAVTALVTGAFHQDGLADIADAFGGGWDREQRLVILKDSRHGTYGVMALVLSTAVQFSALASMTAAWGLAALVAAHTLARSAVLVVLLTARPARPEGLGTDYATGLRRGAVVVGAAVGVGVTALMLGPWAALAVAAVTVTSISVVVLAQRKIGGISGDVLGAIEQVAEGAVLVVVAGVAHAGHLPWWR
ncbi:MAG TPA: adenosylcobinamide-GDP ribazoletransferase [Ilumatobacteraceae bacterium]